MKELLKLHIGCGARVLKGWINIDLKFTPYQAYLKHYTDRYYPKAVRGGLSDFHTMDMTKQPLPFLDDSVAIVFHEDFLEHLDQKGQILFLAETWRVLKKGSVHRVNTPNLLVSMERSRFSQGRQGVYIEEWNRWHHRNVLTPSTLEELALMVGYSEVVFTGRDQSSSELVPPEYRPDPRDRPEDGNIFADLIK